MKEPRNGPAAARGRAHRRGGARHGTCAPALPAEAGRSAPVGLGRRLLDALIPPACVDCGAGLPPARPPVCALCWHRLPRIPPPHCERCGATHPGAGAGLAAAGACPDCQDWPEALRRAAAPFRMEAGAARLVRGLKYGGWRSLAEPMGRAMAEAARRLAPPGEGAVLVPVPLAPARARERGFNQAELLARALGEATGWPCVSALVRVRTGRRQARLGRRGRSGNVKGAFHAAAGSRRRRLAVLVDDVVTTGSTAAACAEALLEAGTPCAGVVSFARASTPLGGRA